MDNITGFLASQPGQHSRILAQAQCAHTFKEFFAQNLTDLRYQLKTHSTKLMWYFGRRGPYRDQQKKKNKCVGEL